MGPRHLRLPAGTIGSLCICGIAVRFVQMVLTDTHPGERVAHFPLSGGALVLVDRHSTTAHSIGEPVTWQAAVVLRMCAQRLSLYRADSARLHLLEVLQTRPQETIQAVAVPVKTPQSQGTVTGYVQASRLAEEAANRARQRVLEWRTQRGRRSKTPRCGWPSGSSCLQRCYQRR
jgi:hypothetical protein